MRKQRNCLAVAAAIAAGSAMFSQPARAQDLDIQAYEDLKLERERAAAAYLEEMLAKHDLGRWIFTRRIIVEHRAVPHSHPVLTINTRNVGREPAFLSTFLHEQFHWLAEENADAVGRAVAALRAAYPDVPDRDNGGARDEASTYLHLIVCMLEFDALAALFGESAARETLAGSRVYAWIYDKVLNDPEPIREAMAAEGLALP